MSLLHRFLVAIAVLLIATSARAQTQNELILGVSEGTSGGLDHARVIAKYGGLADAIGRAIKRSRRASAAGASIWCWRGRATTRHAPCATTASSSSPARARTGTA
jgi:hypothetical protein